MIHKYSHAKYSFGLPFVSLNTGICHQPQQNALGALTPCKIPLIRWTKIPETWKKFHVIESQMHRNKLIIYSDSLNDQDNIYIFLLYSQPPNAQQG